MLESVGTVDSYLTFVSEEQKQVVVQVNRAASMLKHTPIDLLGDMRLRAHRWPALWLSVFPWRDIWPVFFGFLFDA